MSHGQSVYPRVSIDPQATTFRASIPFDVPFVLVGKAEAGLDTVRGFFVPYRSEKDRPESCPDNLPGSLRDAPLKKRQYTLIPWVRQSKYIAADSFDVGARAQDAGARLMACLTFVRRLSATEDSAFQKAAFTKVDSVLREMDPALTSSQITGDQVMQLKRALAHAMISAGIRVQTKPGSLVDTTRPVADSDEARTELQSIQQTHGERHSQLDQRDSESARADSQLHLLARNAALAHLVDAYVNGSASGRSPPFDTAVVVASILITADSEPARTEIHDAAFGVEWLHPHATPPNGTQLIPTPWDSAECDRYLSEVSRTLTALAEIEALVDDEPGHLTPPERQAVLERIWHMKSGMVKVQSTLLSVQTALVKRREAIKHLVNLANVRVVQVTATHGTSIGTLESRTKNYISADVGVLAAPVLNAVAAYAGANIYLRAINKDVPLTSFWDVPRRFAFSLGITLTSVAKTNVRDNLFASQAGVAGIGYRITDAIRLGGGALIFKRLDPNPLLDRPRVTTSPYFSVSLDWDVKSTIGKLGDALFK